MKKQKTALITGIGGQDGSYLAELLLSKGTKVRGIVRRSSNPNTDRIYHLMKKYGEKKNKDSSFYCQYADLTDASSIRSILDEFQPDEIYNLASQSHVGVSFNNPISTFDINALGPLRILDAIREMKLSCKYYQASSSEMFGKVKETPQNEETPFAPRSSYGISKVAGYYLTRNYREAYNLHASNGILFNHESPRRGFEFVTRKISYHVARIKNGIQGKLKLGNIKAKRDWGHAKDYVQAMWLILQQDKPDDYVIGTGQEHSVEEFAKKAFDHVGLNYKDYLVIDQKLVRPAEVDTLLADFSKAKKILNWEPKISFDDLVKSMVEHDLEHVKKNK